MSGIKVTSLVSVLRPLGIPSVISPERHTYVVAVRWTDELLCGRYKWVQWRTTRGGGPAWKIQGKVCFQGKHKLLKNPECKNYIQCSDNFQGKLCFSGQAQVVQNYEWLKIYIQYSEFRAHSVFQGKHKFLKSPERYKIFQHSEKFQGNSVFQGEKVVQKSKLYKNQWRAVRGG